jgi:ribonuclease HII
LSRGAASSISEDEEARLRRLFRFDLRIAPATGQGTSTRAARALKDTPAVPALSVPIAGLDEAGRGALAGPLVVGCVSLGPLSAGLLDRATGTKGTPLRDVLLGVDDSKRLTPRRREALFARLSTSVTWSIGWCSAADVDHRGVVQAAAEAATEALDHLPIQPEVVLLDHGLEPDPARGPVRRSTIVRGDRQSLHIAAASIVAKVVRDRVMEVLDQRFPGYGFAGNKGYGTAAHLAALERLGPSPVHRRTFRRVLPSTQGDGD